MRKDINDYKMYVFDLDGTLYDQPKLRLIMAKRLITFYLFHPFRIKELIILSYFRKVKDAWTSGSSEADIIDKVARDKGSDVSTVSSVVRKWIYDDPLSALPLAKDEKIIGWMDRLRSEGKNVVIFSDYPAAEKMKALGAHADRQYDPNDERIEHLKPSPDGLFIIMKDYGLSPQDVLMIGDRAEKDGMSAKAAGCDHLILERSIKKRDHEKIGF